MTRCVRCRALASPERPGRKVCVVGGGVGGMCTAGLLSKRGFRDVTLIEQNTELGGRMVSSEIDGYRFDTGPSLLLFPSTYLEMFEALGVSDVELKQIHPAGYRIFFGGSSGGCDDALDLLWDVDDMAAQYESREHGAGDRYREFLKFARNALELGMPNFIEKDLSKIDAKSLMDLLPQAMSINPLELLVPLDLLLRRYFKSARLRQAFTFQTLYVGLTPYNAPGVFSLLAATELTDGVWYPIGGFQQVRDGIEKAIRKLGVNVQTGLQVEGIVVEDGRVVGVRTANGVMDADIVVCNRDLADSYGLIEGDEGAVVYAEEKEQRLGRLHYSTGVISYLFCVNKKVDGLLHHNVFINERNPKEAWRPARSATELSRYPNFYVHVPSKTDPTAAPPGHESIMVLLPVANMKDLSSMDSYEELVSTGREFVLEFMAEATGQDFETSIVSERTIDPVEWRQRYGLKYGAAFGLSHGLDQLSLFRPPAEESNISGLFFAGASTRPGNGVPLVMIGSRLVSERIADIYNDS